MAKRKARKKLIQPNKIVSRAKKAKISTAFLLATIGLFLIMLSRSPPTAAVVGAFELPTSNLIMGIILFLIGLVVFPKR